MVSRKNTHNALAWILESIRDDFTYEEVSDSWKINMLAGINELQEFNHRSHVGNIVSLKVTVYQLTEFIKQGRLYTKHDPIFKQSLLKALESLMERINRYGS